MSTVTLQSVFDAARAQLGDTQVSGGEVFTNTILQPHFNEPYRTMFSCLQGVSKRVQRVVYLNLPANQTVLIPSTFNITDLSEPEMVEERPGSTTGTITSTDTSTPVRVTSTAHGLTTGAEVIISGVATSTAAWGQWFIDVIDANTFSLRGSASDGSSGTGGNWSASSQQTFSEVRPVDLTVGALDGVPNTYLSQYLWINEQFQFRGANQIQQLRITYWASGDPPTNSNTVLRIDNCQDFLAFATASNAARVKGWNDMSDRLFRIAYGDDVINRTGGLIGQFIGIQVMTLQRGPSRRRLPFRDHKSRFGDFVIG